MTYTLTLRSCSIVVWEQCWYLRAAFFLPIVILNLIVFDQFKTFHIFKRNPSTFSIWISQPFCKVFNLCHINKAWIFHVWYSVHSEIWSNFLTPLSVIRLSRIFSTGYICFDLPLFGAILWTKRLKSIDQIEKKTFIVSSQYGGYRFAIFHSIWIEFPLIYGFWHKWFSWIVCTYLKYWWSQHEKMINKYLKNSNWFGSYDTFVRKWIF